MQSLQFNIIGKANGVGLSRDLSLLTDALRCAGHDVAIMVIDRVQANRRRSVFAQWRARTALLVRCVAID